VLIQGNHDYWWQSVSKLRALPLQSTAFIQNDHVLLGDGWAACGTRGWICPGDRAWAEDPEHNQKIYDREVQRLGLSLASAARAGAKQIIAMLHYPPFDESGRPTAFTDMLTATPGVEACLYGHIHSAARHETAVQGNIDGVTYHLVAADYLRFQPKLIVP
jgi:predicted phosphohydrolase